MTSSGRSVNRWLVPSVAAGIALVAILVQWWFSGVGQDAPDFALFVGRLHPLVVHLPIGILILVVCLEVAAFYSPLRASIDITLEVVQPLALATCFLSFLFGHLLGWEGGFSQERLDSHRQLALVTVLCVSLQLVAWRFARGRETAGARLVYRVALAVSLLSLSGAAHVGGTLSRGEGYLARYAPGFLQPLLGGKPGEAPAPVVAPEPGTEALLFAQAVQPMLNQYCSECHGSEKAKGGLRVDSLAALLKGGDGGPSIVPGNPEASHLLGRSELPPTDEDFMPPEGNPAPSVGEVAMLRFWILRGAKEDLPLRDALPPAEARSALEHALSRVIAPAKAAAAPQGGTATANGDSETAASSTSTKASNDTQPSGDENSEQTASEEVAPATPVGLSAFAVLQEKCADCHGSHKQKAQFRVDTVSALFEGGKSGPGIVAGNARAGSLLGALSLPLDAKGHMPPKNKSQLTETELQGVRNWVALQAKNAPKPPSTAVDSTSIAAVATSVSHSDQESLVAASEPALGVEKESPSAHLDEFCLKTQAPPPGQALVFDEVIHPLLQDKCAGCHEAELSSGGLSVQDCEALFRGGDSGAVLVAGDSAGSTLVSRLLLPQSDDEHMPPSDYPQLSASEIESLREWIDGGARRDAVAPLSQLPQSVAESRRASAQAEQAEKATKLPQERAGCAVREILNGTRTGGQVWLGALMLLGFAGWRRLTTRREQADI